MRDKFLSMAGLCKKAGKIVIGSELSVGSIKGGKAKLAVLAGDASKNSVKEIERACEQFNIKLIKSEYTKLETGAALGFNEVAAFTIVDNNFAKALINIWSEKAINGGIY